MSAYARTAGMLGEYTPPAALFSISVNVLGRTRTSRSIPAFLSSNAGVMSQRCLTILWQRTRAERNMPNLDSESLLHDLESASVRGEMASTPPPSRPGFDLSAAYQAESRLEQWRLAKGHQNMGRKVGYGNKAKWPVLKLETLVWGHMYDDTVHQADGNSAQLAIPPPRSLKIAPASVFALKQPLTSETSDQESALEAVSGLALGYVIDRTFSQWRFQPSDFVASYGLHTALMVGQGMPVDSDITPQAGGRTVSIQGANVQEWGVRGRGLRQELLARPGAIPGRTGPLDGAKPPDQPLSRAKMMSSGTLTAGHATQAGDEWRCGVEGLPLPCLRWRLGLKALLSEVGEN